MQRTVYRLVLFRNWLHTIFQEECNDTYVVVDNRKT